MLYLNATGSPWTAQDTPALTGKNIIITGANSGIGFEAAKVLAEKGATVTLACRNLELAEQAAGKIKGDVKIGHLDLSSFGSIRRFAEEQKTPVNTLINNAGLMRPKHWTPTAEGHEIQWGVNHLGHFLLTALLWPNLLESDSPRVTTVASIAHFGGDKRVTDASPKEHYNSGKAYSQSKLANLLFTHYLAQAQTKVIVNACHPGVASTNLFTNKQGLGSSPFIRTGLKLGGKILFQPPSMGALPTLYAATVGENNSYTGPQKRNEWAGPIGPAKESNRALDEDLAWALWKITEEKARMSFPL